MFAFDRFTTTKTAELLTDLAKPSSVVIETDVDTWMPRGLMDWKETTLIDDGDFLDSNKRKALGEWWHKDERNWDIASACTIEGMNDASEEEAIKDLQSDSRMRGD